MAFLHSSKTRTVDPLRLSILPLYEYAVIIERRSLDTSLRRLGYSGRDLANLVDSVLADQGNEFPNRLLENIDAIRNAELRYPVAVARPPAPPRWILDKLRHLVENGFLDFKQWRGMASRYAKRTASYLAACQLRAAMIWTNYLATPPSERVAGSL